VLHKLLNLSDGRVGHLSLQDRFTDIQTDIRTIKSPDSSIVTVIRLWAGWTIRVLGFNCGKELGFFSLHHCIQNVSGANPASYQWV
jgi:hypothetical protein